MEQSEKFIAAGIQMDVAHRNPEKNLEKALSFIDRAIEKNAKIICLPELFTTGFDYDYIKEYAKPIPNKLTEIIEEKAKKSNVCIIAGSIPEKKKDGIYNTSVFFNKDGGTIGKYSKMHLFPLMDEDKYFQKGRKTPIFKAKGRNIGVMICYDLRFPELARKLTLLGADIIFMPSEFPYPRLDHWKTLIKARAIENQIYFMAVNRVGKDNSNVFFGNTSVVDPWGELIADSGDKECIVTAEIDLSKIRQVRKQMPCLDNRVSDLY